MKNSRHLFGPHKNHPRTIPLKKLSSQERLRELEKLRCEGIYLYNQNVAQDGGDTFQCRRRDRVCDTGLKPYCAECKQFLSKKHFSTHKCPSTKKERRLLSALCIDDVKFKDFEISVLAAFRDDVVGQAIKSDKLILQLGFEEYKGKKVAGKEYEAARRVRNYMRTLTRLISIGKEKAKEEGLNTEDFFARKNLRYLEYASDQLVRGEEASSIKKNRLYY